MPMQITDRGTVSMKNGKTYFAELYTKGNGYIQFVYESKYRRNTTYHYTDFMIALQDYNKRTGKNIVIDIGRYTVTTWRRNRAEHRIDIAEHIHVLNRRNMEEEAFGYSRVIYL